MIICCTLKEDIYQKEEFCSFFLAMAGRAKNSLGYLTSSRQVGR